MSKILLSFIITSKDRLLETRLLVAKIFELASRSAALDVVEIILIDDGSHEPFSCEKGETLIIIRNEQSFGAPRARQQGLMIARGDFIHFHDSDDDVASDWLEKVIQILLAVPNLDLLVTSRINVLETKRSAVITPKYLQKKSGYPAHIRRFLEFENCVGPLGGVVFSKQSSSRFSFPHMPSCQDWHMYWEALTSNSNIYVASDIVFFSKKYGSDRISNSLTRKLDGYHYFLNLIDRGQIQKNILIFHFGAHQRKLFGFKSSFYQNILYYTIRKLLKYFYYRN